MSDLLEDQKIHFIVKDYRRMFNEYQTLKTVIEQQVDSLEKKDKEILSLRAKVNELQAVKPKKVTGSIKGKLTELECKSRSIIEKLRKSIEQEEKNINDVEELRQLINV